MRFSANILHRRKRDKGDRRKVFQFHIVDGVADIQKFHLERVTDVAIVLRIVSETEVAVMDEVALVVFHGIDDDVKFFCDITDDGF